MYRENKFKRFDGTYKVAFTSQSIVKVPVKLDCFVMSTQDYGIVIITVVHTNKYILTIFYDSNYFQP